MVILNVLFGVVNRTSVQGKHRLLFSRNTVQLLIRQKRITSLAMNCSQRYFSLSMYEKPSHYSGGTRGTIAFHQLYLLKLHFPYRSSISFGSIIARLIRVSRIETSRCSKSRQKSHLTPSFVYAISSVHNKESDSSELLRCKLIFNHRWRGGKRLSHSSNRLSISFYPATFAW